MEIEAPAQPLSLLITEAWPWAAKQHHRNEFLSPRELGVRGGLEPGEVFSQESEAWRKGGPSEKPRSGAGTGEGGRRTGEGGALLSPTSAEAASLLGQTLPRGDSPGGTSL